MSIQLIVGVNFAELPRCACVDNVTSPWSGNADNATLDNDNNYNGTYDNDHYISDDDEPKAPTARHAAVALVRYLFPVIILVGTTGNALSAAVMLRRRMRATSIYCYLLVLALVDTLVLYVSAFKTWLRFVSGVEWLHASTLSCRSLMFLLLIALHLSAWLIVVVSADRFVAVWMPLRAMTLCTPRRAMLVCAAIIGVIVAANLHVFWTIHLIQYDDGPPMCVPLPDDWFMNVAFNYIKFASYSAVPFVASSALLAVLPYPISILSHAH